MQAADLDLRVGVATADITPAPGCLMGGYWQRERGADSVADPLAAKVLVWQEAGRRAVLVTLDLVGLAHTTVEQLRLRLAERFGIEAAACMVCCSHTHAGPLSFPFRGMGPVDVDYIGRLLDSVVAAVGRAVAVLRPALQRYIRLPLSLGVNRRQSIGGRVCIGADPDGPVVPYAHAVFIEDSAGVLATLFSHPCHPVVLGSDNYQISADFPGIAARNIEAALRAPALYFNGACGDINPRLKNAGAAGVEKVGSELAAAVIEGRGAAAVLVPRGIGAVRQRLELPLLPLPSAWRSVWEQVGLQLKTQIKGLIQRGSGGGVLAGRVAWASERAALARRGGTSYQPFEIQAIRAGGLTLLGMEGELFARYQLELEASAPEQPTLFCGYANGCVGYVPTADEYCRGGYEIEEAYKVYPSVQMLAPQSEHLVRDQALEVLRQVGA